MLKWLLVLMALGAFWTGSVHALSMPSGSWVIPASHGESSPTGKLTAWLFQNAPGTESVPQVREEQGGVLTAGLVSKALSGQNGTPGFRPVNAGPSALWLLAGFLAMLLAVGAATWWYRKPAAE